MQIDSKRKDSIVTNITWTNDSTIFLQNHVAIILFLSCVLFWLSLKYEDVLYKEFPCSLLFHVQIWTLKCDWYWFYNMSINIILLKLWKTFTRQIINIKLTEDLQNISDFENITQIAFCYTKFHRAPFMSTSLIGHEKYLSCRVLLSLEGIFALVQAKLVKIDENMQLKHL